tara:strand:+ start:384 stop:764 length:381 start_codon:yes stop_codon:yes gene_type:complete
MSTLKVNTIQNTSAAHSSTPEEIAQGRAKAWIHFNGTGTVAIKDSFNVSSLTDNSTGLYTITLSITMANDDYCVQCTAHMWEDHSDDNARITAPTKMTTTSFRQATIYGTGSHQDCQNSMATVFGD